MTWRIDRDTGSVSEVNRNPLTTLQRRFPVTLTVQDIQRAVAALERAHLPPDVDGRYWLTSAGLTNKSHRRKAR